MHAVNCTTVRCLQVLSEGSSAITKLHLCSNPIGTAAARCMALTLARSSALQSPVCVNISGSNAFLEQDYRRCTSSANSSDSLDWLDMTQTRTFELQLDR
jgi:hypothetical protein